MLDKTEDLSLATATWLEQFESALHACDGDALKALFHRDSYWRDVLALNDDSLAPFHPIPHAQAAIAAILAPIVTAK